MYVNVAVLKETHPHERRVALMPSVADKLGAKLHMQSGATDAVKLTDAAFKNVAFIDDRDSNYRMARDAFLSRVPVADANIHAVPTEGLSPDQAASAYETTLKQFYGADTL